MTLTQTEAIDRLVKLFPGSTGADWVDIAARVVAAGWGGIEVDRPLDYCRCWWRHDEAPWRESIFDPTAPAPRSKIDVNDIAVRAARRRRAELLRRHPAPDLKTGIDPWRAPGPTVS